MTDAKENNIKKILVADAASQEVAEKAVAEAKKNLDEEMRLRRIKLIKVGVILMLAAIVMIFMTIAWFTMNRETTTSGMNITTSPLPFYIRSAEATDTSYWDEYKGLINLADSKYGVGDLEHDNEKNYYKTGSSSQEIIWRLEDTETGSDDSIYSVGLSPGSNGTLTFEVVPTKDGDIALDLNFDIRGFAAVYPTQAEIESGANASEIKSMNEILMTGSGSSADEKNALKYINGHVLFFKNRATVNGEYQYSGFIDDVYHWQRQNVTKNTGYEIKVYWVWVNTIDQIIIKSTDSGKPLLADNSTSDRNSIINYINENRANIFHDIPHYDVTAETEDEENYDFDSILSELDYDTYIAAGSSSTRKNMEDSYNAADQIIGVNINYILLDMHADLGTVNSE